ncbi:coproporphyrinogen III oxidase [Putridiphycobacter roseus]|uniref:Heme chaperone HemW n=1 Tax=Putridiphycobacter roseus TaxID=2219161 RepID=A0A2W1NAT8_9FLAO|nr:radical SAM family heme chaperone HemW [Putridiphycobacter roseus]PZE16375.1 coproporphyrinogen III oxidase [Putridiphycobacter roseus]
MAGIYIHIPFCKIKCHYCDFHFSVKHNNIPDMLVAIKKELLDKADYAEQDVINTIYFGGGTPSLIEPKEIKAILEVIKANYTLGTSVEYTLECNPDDLSKNILEAYQLIGINRLSIGIQSFDEDQLTFLNRAHKAAEAIDCIEIAQAVGFKNITIDLIYGLPNTDEVYWQRQVDLATQLNVPHISAYCLTFEEKTVFGHLLKTGKIKPLEDEPIQKQFQILTETLRSAGFEQYEISNFAKDGFISKHNSAYWKGVKYIGIGPSAHSFNGKTRQWNIANNALYIQKVKNNISYYEVETLSDQDHFNEYILTQLRTKWGLSLATIAAQFPNYLTSFKSGIEKFCESGDVIVQDRTYTLTEKGKLIADYISSDLFIV